MNVHPVRVEEKLKFLWCSLKMFLSNDDVSTCVLCLITISAACFLDMFQNAGCVNQTWPFNISSYILNKSSNNEKRLTLKLNNFLFKTQSSDQKHILAWFPLATAAREWVSEWGELRFLSPSNPTDMKLFPGLVPTESTTKSSISHGKHWPRRKTVRKVQLWWGPPFSGSVTEVLWKRYSTRCLFGTARLCVWALSLARQQHVDVIALRTGAAIALQSAPRPASPVSD